MSSTNSATDFAPPPPGFVSQMELTRAGEYISHSTKFLIAELMMYGAYFVLVVIAVYTIAKRPHRTARTYWLIAALVITFSVTTVMCALDLAGCLYFYKVVFIDGSLPTVIERFSVYNLWIRSKHVEVLGLWIGSTGDMGFVFLISDILASWRALAVWRFSSRRFLALTQCFLIFSSFALWIACAGRQMTPSRRSGLPDDNAIVANSLIIASSIASIAANVVATSMIGYTAYRYRRTSEHSTGLRLQATKILLLLAESGVIYAMIQIIRLALTATPLKSASATTASAVFQSSTQVVTAMYTPTLIILIHYGYSIADTMQGDTIDGKDYQEHGTGVDHQLSAIRFRHTGRSDTEHSTVTVDEGASSDKSVKY
ncbi:hypothetical protein BDV98DRAFT_602727 [Pterulicium gracile]|uniref:Uncharacterized protein n=1 Tax=Pterulicium gracile TaxID=1884261 RepID=A0A5C3QY18_9AGAR|nr:hypothetical protein BDV98DRAFT_602727 [Pterula gracilis]